ncbi:MAG: hypothetical protein GXO19_05405 [Epsilonproteobacteria bacterium]|nr:hypothetical protein [Campylobacterota bacterium]NPA57154.1 hypothetical protein [Campylobacterota bacterium]
MVKALATLLILFSLSYGKIIDALAAVVNSEPITTYEIQKLVAKLHIPPQKALELLIQKRLEEEQIKKLGIEVDDFELEEALETFARNKGMDTLALREAIESQGLPWEVYRETFREQLMRKKLYDKISKMEGKNISEKELREYYENHKEEFTIARKAKVQKYISPSKEVLQKIQHNPLYRPDTPALLVTGEEELHLDRINPAFANMINHTPEGGFTPIIPLPNDDRYLLIMVESKSDKEEIPFDQVREYILNKLVTQNRGKSVKEYFDKLRASAQIKILRMPKGE